jgi:transposase
LAAKKTSVKNLIELSREAIEKDQTLSASAKFCITSLTDALSILMNELGLNSKNSSKPPSSDPNRVRRKTTSGTKRKPGGQNGHTGSHLKLIESPDVIIEELVVDRSLLPAGNWEADGFERRQVVDIEVNFIVTEYRAEILKNNKGVTFIADFPEGVTEPAQYGLGVKATAVYLSQHQLIPQERVRDALNTQYGLSISKGSINNFIQSASQKLTDLKFEDYLRNKLIASPLLHADETGVNVNGVRHWIHCLCNESYTYFFADPKRGQEAMDRMGVLLYFQGTLVHDHWKPYFRYICTHVLCNAHHRRELERAFEQDNQMWAQKMKIFLDAVNVAVEKDGGKLSDKAIIKFQKKYRNILKTADRECPENLTQRAQTKSRNLLERLIEFEEETLRFMGDELTPFTNNQGERDLRMIKVQQKVSGCFRAEKGARNFCLIKSYLSTCRKNGVHPIEALRTLFENKLPEFMR